MTGSSVPTIAMNDGLVLPAIGFGTFRLNGAAGVEGVAQAIRTGYRLLDSAFNYENEGAVGAAIRKAGVPREELFVTSKLPGRHHALPKVIPTVEESLYRSGLDYFDIYLIHWPNPSKGLYVEAWQGLIEARKRGLIRSIGVCNFLPEHIDKLIAETGVTPAINQIELHPYFPQSEQRAFDKLQGIVTESWSPLGRANSVLQEPAVRMIAQRLGRTIPQVILRWHVQLGALPLPKASGGERQRENLAIFDFDLSPEDMAAIATLARQNGRNANQDPNFHEEM